MCNWISFTENHYPGTSEPHSLLVCTNPITFHSNGHLPSTGIGMAGGGSGVGHHVHHPGHHPGSAAVAGGYGHHLSNAGSVLVGNAGRYGQVPSPAPNGRVPSPAPGDGCNPYQGGKPQMFGNSLSPLCVVKINSGSLEKILDQESNCGFRL